MGDDDKCCYQHGRDDGKSVDDEDADAVINCHLQSDEDEEDSLCLLDGVTILFDERRGSESGHWETALKSLKIAVGVAGVGLALYAAYKYFGN